MTPLNYELVFNTLVSKTREYLESNDIKSMVLGISGGIDSTIVAIICNEVFKQTGISFIGRSLPIKNGSEEFFVSEKVGKIFCKDFKVVNLKDTYSVISKNFEKSEVPGTPVSEGNIQARLRMSYLYNLASINNGIVFSTDNATEYNLGFWTLHGDVGDFNPLFGLWKTEIYGLAKWIFSEKFDSETEWEETKALALSISLTPTDGLGISNSDLEQIGGKSYKEVDSILQELLAWKKISAERGDKFSSSKEMMEAFLEEQSIYDTDPVVIDKVVRRHFASEFKRKNLPIVIERKEYFEGI